MAKDPKKHTEYEDQLDAEDLDGLEGEEDGEEYEPIVPERPTCPRCGWHNTRPSHTKGILDSVLRTFSLRPYRCRSCGNRFRVIRRAGQV
jgi:DNA-directed RNA polymerase subunit M/transcription elongation factor TFIIS